LIPRRKLLAGVGTAIAGGLAGCGSNVTAAEPAHTVSLYLHDSETARTVSVRIIDDAGTTVFETERTLSARNEADENVPFPATSNPETIIVTIDGTRFERDWPGFEQPELPCNEANDAGVEIWIETAADGSPAIRLEANCQSVTMNE
jgi:hypothetical protein